MNITFHTWWLAVKLRSDWPTTKWKNIARPNFFGDQVFDWQVVHHQLSILYYGYFLPRSFRSNCTVFTWLLKNQYQSNYIGNHKCKQATIFSQPLFNGIHEVIYCFSQTSDRGAKVNPISYSLWNSDGETQTKTNTILGFTCQFHLPVKPTPTARLFLIGWVLNYSQFFLANEKTIL